MSSTPSKDDAIVIVGAGIFGLSTALHLSGRGYRNVTVFDRQNYDERQYSYLKGCDAASADLNKIIRSAYGSQTEYQEMTLEAVDVWNSWNAALAAGDVPPGMSRNDKIFHNIGAVSMNEGTILPPFEVATIKAMAANGHAGTQLVTTNKDDLETAKKRRFNMDPFNSKTNGKSTVGVMDTSGGHVVADKACRYALHKARKNGAKFVLDPTAGAFKSFIKNSKGDVLGIQTEDGKVHLAKLTIMACGGWTPSLVPELDGLAETTAGSVVVFKLPKESPLFNRFAPENFPVWMFKMRDGAMGGLYGFPRDDDGLLKIGFRGVKYTNPQVQADGKERSVPVTRWSEGEKLTEIPRHAMRVVKKFVSEYLPEVVEAGLDVEFTRVCWYTDTPDNHFVVDEVPGAKGLMVATGGSGHAFKLLPNIGKWVADVIEKKGMDRAAIKAWKWQRTVAENPINVLMEGSKGARALQNVELTNGKDKKFGSLAKL